MDFLRLIELIGDQEDPLAYKLKARWLEYLADHPEFRSQAEIRSKARRAARE
jgi:hypothetical protein